MNRIIANSLAILLLVGFTTVANAQDREERSLDSFSSLKVGESINVTLEKGSSERAIVEVRGIDLEDVHTEVRGDRLRISQPGHRLRRIHRGTTVASKTSRRCRLGVRRR